MSHLKIDNLIRTRRKTIGLQITKEAQLIVRAPIFAPEFLIHKLIQCKESWIRKKQEYFRKQQHTAKIKQFVLGEEFLFLGKNYPLVLAENQSEPVMLNGALNISQAALGNVKSFLESWYKQQACQYIAQRLGVYANQSGLQYQSVRISNAGTRWGSCGAKNTINFTWRLIMAPARVIDYVIVHELMHIKQKNHSHKFWKEVALIVPDYKQDESWLKANGYLLAWA